MTTMQPRPHGPGPAHAETLATSETVVTSGRFGPLRRALPLAPAARMMTALATRPSTVARRGAALAVELAAIGLGRGAPRRQDPSHDDPARSENPLLLRLVQAHAATHAAARDLVAAAGLDAADDERLRSAVGTVAAALAPGNVALHPAAQRAAAWSGASLVRGATRLVTGRATSRVPPTVEPEAFEVGTDIATAPGAVVLRTPVFDLIQYLPQTEEVRDLPVLVVPPMATRHHPADLAPGAGIVEHLVRGGRQVFAVSWRDAGDLDTYGQAVLDAMDACEHITRTTRTNLMAFGSGGTLTAMLLAHLAATGMQERVSSVTFVATVLDRDEMSAGHPVAAVLLGTAVDLSKVDRPAYVVAGAGGTPPTWRSCYHTTRLLGGDSRFVLAAGDSRASAGCPPGEDAPSFRAAEAEPDVESWLGASRPVTGPWWSDHLAWLDEHSGPLRDAPPELGGRGFYAIAPAPGDHVLRG